jgi:pentatricopeptide repeat protein
MIQAYGTRGQGREALKMFRDMQQYGVAPNDYTFTTVLCIISELGDKNEGDRIHAQLKVSHYNLR